MTKPLLARRLGRTPQLAHERWEGGVVRLPTWIERGPDGRPFRPYAAIWVSPMRHKLHLRLLEPGADEQQAALNTFVEFATKPKLADCLPVRADVSDEGVAAALRAALGDLPIEIAVRAELPEVNEVVHQMLTDTQGVPLRSMLSAPGVTVDAMRAFADAAERFYEARPWTRLESVDLIRIEEPDQGQDLQLTTVLGAGGNTFGLGFFRSLEEHEAVSEAGPPEEALRGRRWLLAFGPAWDMAPDDVDVWEREALPLAGEDAYPLIARIEFNGEPRRPDAGHLAWFEGLLRAIASSSEEEIDTGRWAKQVETSQGAKRFVLSLPGLLEPPIDQTEIDPDSMEQISLRFQQLFESRELQQREEVHDAVQELSGQTVEELTSREPTPREAALKLAFEARRAAGRRQLQLVRQALALSRDCADAYIVLGDRENDPQSALSYYEQAVAAGERSLPSEARAHLEEDSRDSADLFWDDPRTRPYMRARASLAGTLLGLGRYDEARAHLLALLRINPGDTQGLRHTLLGAAIERGDTNTGDDLLRDFSIDESGLWLYGAALHVWKAGRHGDAKRLLRRAIRANRRVVKYLAGSAEWPEERPMFYRPGDESEAIIIAHQLGDLWLSIPGAALWLKAQAKRK